MNVKWATVNHEVYQARLKGPIEPMDLGMRSLDAECGNRHQATSIFQAIRPCLRSGRASCA
jgi:hypothetical protein